MVGFQSIVGQEQLKAHIKGALETHKVSHAYIISGEKSSGKVNLKVPSDCCTGAVFSTGAALVVWFTLISIIHPPCPYLQSYYRNHSTVVTTVHVVCALK